MVQGLLIRASDVGSGLLCSFCHEWARRENKDLQDDVFLLGTKISAICCCALPL